METDHQSSKHPGDAMNRMRTAASRLIVDQEGKDFLVHRDIYRDPEVFEWEMRYIFEGTWNLIGLESQIPACHDFMSAYIGRTPVLVTRDAQGKLHCVINSCRHKGALVAHRHKGNARSFVCQYHGWSYDSSGKNVHIKDRDEGAY
ncbi:MAG: aromatic ring-hydroxylating oxygenase subunit alpha, partial [Noviherbaspirillum sp.]